jgi:hypothetical protein
MTVSVEVRSQKILAPCVTFFKCPKVKIRPNLVTLTARLAMVMNQLYEKIWGTAKFWGYGKYEDVAI